ncbi:hypothetical protein ACLOJK_011864 [Asimina triloba]
MDFPKKNPSADPATIVENIETQLKQTNQVQNCGRLAGSFCLRESTLPNPDSLRRARFNEGAPAHVEMEGGEARIWGQTGGAVAPGSIQDEKKQIEEGDDRNREEQKHFFGFYQQTWYVSGASHRALIVGPPFGGRDCRMVGPVESVETRGHNYKRILQVGESWNWKKCDAMNRASHCLNWAVVSRSPIKCECSALACAMHGCWSTPLVAILICGPALSIFPLFRAIVRSEPSSKSKTCSQKYHLRIRTSAGMAAYQMARIRVRNGTEIREIKSPPWAKRTVDWG